MERLCGFLFSRWTQGAIFALILAAARMRNRTLWLVTILVVGTAATGMAVVGIAALHRTRDAWRKFPHTPEYEEYAQRKKTEQEHDKNKIEIHK